MCYNQVLIEINYFGCNPYAWLSKPLNQWRHLGPSKGIESGEHRVLRNGLIKSPK